ncbi:MAG: hypothetical protein NZL98_06190 [Anaerolineales bacterium]|nr:hypothetical protein [Anaerolineales bacterium]
MEEVAQVLDLRHACAELTKNEFGAPIMKDWMKFFETLAVGRANPGGLPTAGLYRRHPGDGDFYRAGRALSKAEQKNINGRPSCGWGNQYKWGCD